MLTLRIEDLGSSQQFLCDVMYRIYQWAVGRKLTSGGGIAAMPRIWRGSHGGICKLQMQAEANGLVKDSLAGPI